MSSHQLFCKKIKLTEADLASLVRPVLKHFCSYCIESLRPDFHYWRQAPQLLPDCPWPKRQECYSMLLMVSGMLAVSKSLHKSPRVRAQGQVLRYSKNLNSSKKLNFCNGGSRDFLLLDLLLNQVLRKGEKRQLQFASLLNTLSFWLCLCNSFFGPVHSLKLFQS